MALATSHAGSLRRLTGWALIGGLCVAAAVAVLALLTGSFDDTHWRVVATSLGFSAFSVTAAAGAALRARSAAWAQALGGATSAVSACAFVLLVAALWAADDDGIWRTFGVGALLALWGAHASVVLRAVRPADGGGVRAMCAVSVVALGIDTAMGVAALLGVFDDVDSDPAARALAALLVIALLFTALPPILRRFGDRGARPAAEPAHAALGRPADGFAREVAAAADRLAGMDLPGGARAEVDRLRELARDAGA